MAATTAGAQWTFHVEGPWAYLRPAEATLPDQGWKLHVSATEGSALDVLTAAVPVFLAEGAAFKFAATTSSVRVLNSSSVDRGSGGKFLTVYPADDAQAVRVAEACHQATAGLAGPVVLSDRPYRPGSLVHYRYGGFSGEPIIDADGIVTHILRGPGGELVIDERSAGYRAPSWVEDPFQPAAAAAPGPGVSPRSQPPAKEPVLHDRYLVRGALRHSNKGGTYLAEDRMAGDLVVIKEGRPHVASDGAGDAKDRIRHEARMLELVGPVGRAPRLVEVFEQGGHVFLVEEHIAALSLRDMVDDAFDAPETGLSAAEVAALAAQLAETMAAFHTAGVVLRDFTPNNILLRPGGEIVLVDLELAHPAGETPAVPGGTPGYASPGQLAGQPAGVADDYWSLGATIAYVATGTDPYLPAAVAHAWADPERLAAWIGAQVDDGRIEPRIAEIVLGAMAAQPQSRWSPDAVLAALRGEGRRMASGFTGNRRRQPEPQEPGAGPERFAGVPGDVAGWLVSTLGTGPSGHLWPAGPAGLALDPVNVQSGASGVGLFLCQLLESGAGAGTDADAGQVRKALATAAAWVSDRVTRGPQRPPGLYFGLSGVAWFLTEAAAVLGRDDLLRRANELALTLPVRVANPDLSHGTAGVGLALLHQWRASGDDRFLARAVLAAEHLVRTARPGDGDGDAVTWPVPASAPSRLAGTTSYGFAHGNAGIATFLLAAAGAAGETGFGAAALEALDALLPLAVDVEGAAFWPSGPPGPAEDDAEQYWPHWCNGSSGIGTALVRAYAATGEARYLEAAGAAARAGLRERWRSSAVQCHGLAGDAELLLDLATFSGDPGWLALAGQAASALHLQRRAEGPHTVFADDSGAGVSAGFNTGLAGVGSFFLRLTAGGPRPLLLDELLPTAARLLR